MSYISRLPKDIRTLLEHYTLRENWEALRTVLTASYLNLSGAGEISINGCMANLRLQTCFGRMNFCDDVKLYMHTEDLITDVILNIVVSHTIDFTCLIDARLCALGEINGNLEKARSSLRLITTMRNGKYYTTNVIITNGLLSRRTA